MPPEAALQPELIPPPGFIPPHRMLEGRIILVTGPSEGLGKATALACASHGATLVLLGKTVKKLEAVYDQIEAAGGHKPAIYPLNLAGATWNDYAELAANLEREFGRLDGLVHCAAHFTGFSPLGDIGAREWVESIQVNLTAAYTITRHCLPLLTASQAGSVVFVTDAACRDAKPLRGAYGVAKFALEGLARSWSQELGGHPALRVNTYDPGPMRTRLRQRGYPGEDPLQIQEPEAAVPGLLWLLGMAPEGTRGRMFSALTPAPP